MKTKEKILAAALTLFNEDGVENITTRHIARAIDISQGNLHYHFPNRNAVIEGLFEQFLDQVRDAARHTPGQSFEPEQVLGSMEDNFRVMFNFRFLFVDSEVIWRRIPPMKDKLIGLLQAKKQEIHALTIEYRQLGILREDISSEQIDFLAEQFVFAIGTWLTGAEYLRIPAKRTSYFARFLFRFWLPYLKKEEMDRWEGLLAD